ncbi:lysostaphin resistance A-like protein [Brevibacillus fluminis]|uniref:CPBP family intramembrane glutamic endopeptidase n=1 Tax=Brevibacillus fluminis TaxID=511487 RepID=UPI003F8CCA1C
MSLDNQQGREPRMIRLNLYLTQVIILAVALSLSLSLHGLAQNAAYFHIPAFSQIVWAVLIAVAVAACSMMLERLLPENWMDDGGINKFVFSLLSRKEIVLLCFLVGLCEEWLFRGGLQPLIGNGWTSGVFTLLHIRYMKKPVLFIGVFAISYVLGMLFDASGGLIVPVVAHALIDLIQALYVKQRMEKERMT